MKTRYYLVRHAQKIAAIGDVALTQEGKTQALQTGKALSHLRVEKILVSPLARTRQTAEIINQYLHAPVEFSENLRERANWGDDPKQSFADFLTMWQRASKERDWQPPVGLSSYIAGLRFTKALSHAQAKENDGILLVVTHGGIIADFLRNVLPETVIESLYPQKPELLDDLIGNCSITIVDFESKQNAFSLMQFASTSHLT